MENMGEKKTFDEIFEDFAKGMDMESLAFDEDGDCELLFGTDVIVNLHRDDQLETLLTYVIVADIDGLPERDEMLLKMLRGNYFWQGNKGFTIGLEHDSDKVVLMDRQLLDFFQDADFLATYLGACVDTVYEWRQKINDSYSAVLEEMAPGMVGSDGPSGDGPSGDGPSDDGPSGGGPSDGGSGGGWMRV